ncbi:MAG: hypothetical protein V3V99_12915 [candidate division Zixibacteria bacterium]
MSDKIYSSNSETSRMLVFLGSGVSYKSGLPDVNKITNEVLDGKWFKYTDQNYWPITSDIVIPSNDNTKEIQAFLSILKDVIDPYYLERTGEACNYEDLYYVCQQISENEYGITNNPAVNPFIKEMKMQTESLGQLNKLAKYAVYLIHCVVWRLLTNENIVKGFDLIKELIENNIGVDIATLNHDLLIERYLESSGIEYSDGFDKKEVDIRFISENPFESCDKVRVFKLHGSINWFRFEREIIENGKPVVLKRYGVDTINDYMHCRDLNGEYYDVSTWMPMFLSGSVNKLFKYNFGIFKHILYHFDECLNKHNRILMSGYGWSDIGINGRLLEWLGSSMDNALVLLHENPQEISHKMVNSGKNVYDEYKNDGRLIMIKKWFCDSNFDDLNQQA